MTTFATIYKLTCNFTWEKDTRDGNNYTFMSMEGAHKWVEDHLKDLSWYSIEGLAMHPCDENDLGGQVYYGMVAMEFKGREEMDELRKSKEDN